MRKEITIIFLIFTINVFAQAPTNGLIAYWPFNGNANDSTGHGLNGVLNNVTFTTDRFGFQNSTCYFNGTTGIITFPVNQMLDDSIDGAGQATVCGWINADTLGPPQAIFNHWTRTPVSGAIGIQFAVYDTQRLYLSAYHGFNSISYPTTLNSHQWTFVALVYDGSVADSSKRYWWFVNCQKYYVDCAFPYCCSTCNLPSNLGTQANETYIGARSNLGSNPPLDHFKGSIDDLRVYNRALSDSEMYLLSCSGVPPPVASFQSSDTTFCIEGSKCIDFFDFSTGNPSSWQWFFPGASPDTSTQQNPTNICYSATGTYAVILIAANAAGYDTLIVSPMITFANPPVTPVLTVIGGDTIICSHACSYQWYFNGAAIAGATDSFYIASQGGTYSAQISDCIGCSVLSNGITFPLTINELIDESAIKIYPNPVTSTFTLQINSQLSDAVVIINDIVGKEMMRKKLTGSRMEIEKGRLEEGVYFVKIFSAERSWVEKMIVE